VTKEIVYKCARCGAIIKKEDLEKLKLGVRCPRCYYRILYKIRTSGRVYFKAV